MLSKAYIPYKGYFSSPFARWQGSFANLHSIEFAAHVAKLELAKRRIDPANFDYGVLGEGEMPLAELVEALEQGEEPTFIGGLAYRKAGEVAMNPPAVPIVGSATSRVNFPSNSNTLASVTTSFR